LGQLKKGKNWERKEPGEKREGKSYPMACFSRIAEAWDGSAKIDGGVTQRLAKKKTQTKGRSKANLLARQAWLDWRTPDESFWKSGAGVQGFEKRYEKKKNQKWKRKARAGKRKEGEKSMGF